MENKLEELKKENETIETKCKSTEETLSKYKDQTREILRKSKEKITDTVKEKTELAEKLKNTEMELETLKESGNAGTTSTSGLANEAGMRARALEAQLSALKAEKERQNELFNQEREKLQKEIKQMATQQTQTVKPTVSSAPSTARVKSQPQVIVSMFLKIK